MSIVKIGPHKESGTTERPHGHERFISFYFLLSDPPPTKVKGYLHSRYPTGGSVRTNQRRRRLKVKQDQQLNFMTRTQLYIRVLTYKMTTFLTEAA